MGGSQLGSQPVEAVHVGLAKIAKKLKEYKIEGLLVVGGIK